MRKVNPYVSVDCVIFGFDFTNLNVLLIDRGRQVDADINFVLPGDLIYNDEDLDMAAMRVLHELTSLDDIFLEQFAAFGDPGRIAREKDQEWLKKTRKHPEARVVTVGYYSLVKMDAYAPVPASFAQAVKWVPVQDIKELPFDHKEIFDKAFEHLQQKIRFKPIGFNLLPQKFTLGQLQRLYESILNKELDKRNFRRKMQKVGLLKQLNEKQIGVAHKPASYFSFDEETYQELVETGFDNFDF